MTRPAAAAGGPRLLRARGLSSTRVTNTELFFDLVYVFAITQLTHLLLGRLSWLLAERCQLFLIIVLGESVLDTGAAYGGLRITVASTAAVVFAFLASVALWWIYFNRAADDSAAAIAAADDPGRLGRSAYAYFHLPMVAGVIVLAVADDLAIAHPGGHARGALTAAVLGGPALFLAGHALFKRAMFGVLSTPRLAAIVVLAALIPVGAVAPRLALLGAATAVVTAVAVWDTVVPHPAGPGSPARAGQAG